MKAKKDLIRKYLQEKDEYVKASLKQKIESIKIDIEEPEMR